MIYEFIHYRNEFLITKNSQTSIFIRKLFYFSTIDDIFSPGERITLHLYLGAENYENGTQTRNTIIEIEGSQNPEEIVIVSGHLDSWDVGVGAMDDGGKIFPFHVILCNSFLFL